jgi:capsular exopolysaccharide synthesis family protein
MGRIDDALQRAGHRSRVETVSGAVSPQAGQDTFVSPWAFRAGAEERPIAEGPSPNPLAAALDAPFSNEPRGFERFSEAWMPRLVIADKANVRLVEEFRQLAATLHQAQAASNIRVLMVTSAEPGEGKSTTSVNLALTLSESYKRRVLLVDADLRRPSLHEITQVPNSQGLGETLKAAGEHKLPLFKLSETLTLAPAGRPDQNPMGALTSPRMRHILVEASMRFDWVIIDAPPIGPIADSSLLAPLSDGVLLVVRARRTHHASSQKAIEAIGRERLLGVVLNDAEIEHSPAYNRYYHGYYADDARRG